MYRRQVDEQRQINATYGEVLELQVREIRASLKQREDAAEHERRSQAEKVTAWFGEERHGIWGAHIRNASGLPVINVRVSFYYIAEKVAQRRVGNRSTGDPRPRESASSRRKPIASTLSPTPS